MLKIKKVLERKYIGVPIIIILSALVGITLLCIVYSLPTEEIKKNAARSSEIYNYEGVYPQLITGYHSTRWTTARMQLCWQRQCIR